MRSLSSATRESPGSNKDPEQTNINKNNFFLKYIHLKNKIIQENDYIIKLLKVQSIYAESFHV